MKKLLISDFDHTFFTNDGLFNNIKLVNEFRNKGNVFVIASGRHSKSLFKIIEKYGIPFDYLICNDGGIIFDKALNIIYHNNINSSIVKYICDIYDNSPYISDWYIDTGLSISKNKNVSANGIIGYIDDKDIGNDILNSIMKIHPEVHGYVYDKIINIMAKEVSKDNGIKIINDILNINDDNIYTIGNNINDISMSHYNSYCMTNSNLELKKICKKEYEQVFLLIIAILNNRI